MIIKILIVFVSILLNTVSYTQNRYEIKSGKIEYVFSTPLHKGTKTVIFDDSGRLIKEIGVIYIDTSATRQLFKDMTTSRPVIHTLTIKTIDSVYSIDLDSLIGTRRATFNLGISPSIPNMSKTVGQVVFLGKKCDLVDFHGAKIWTWKGIALKKEMPMLDDNNVYEYATSIEENYTIKEDEFKIPKGIRMQ